MKADSAKPSKKRRININYGLQVFGDNNTFSNTSVNNNVTLLTFYTKLIFTKLKSFSFLRLTDEKCGNGVSYRPNLDRSTYEQHLKSHVEETFSLPDSSIPYIDKVFNSDNKSDNNKAIRDIPPTGSDDEHMFNFLEALFRATYSFHYTNLDIKDGESTFDSLFVYPFLEAVSESLAESVNWSKAGFKPGEAPLISMKNQLKNSELYKEETVTYLADGIIKLFGLKNLDILLLETSNHFGCTDKPKINFDHHKDLFGALAMLKNIADEFPFASLATFRQCKVFFLHAAGERLYLWSLSFEPEGPIYELWLERMMLIKPDVDDKPESLPSFLKFFWGMKCNLITTTSTIAQLKKEHNDILIKNRFNPNAPSDSLSTIVNPSILKLTEEDKTGMHLLGPFFSTTSS
ncbi:hypothetical protein HPULCUR_008159 [Helicostylum pulchrum]|uniref:Uncharacterized protein n=1 Tax=Helicostylum pulchrum TaxID=562976 RepID=A0ABP9Y7U9_9FUNG